MNSRWACLILIIFTCASVVVVAVDYESRDGVISIEAEHATILIGWDNIPGQSGIAMQDTSERGQGRMTYNINFNQPGRYYVFLLCRTPNGSSTNDCFIQLDGEKLYAADDSTRPDGMRVHTKELSWTFLPKGPGSHTPDAIRNQPVYTKVTTAGQHMLHIISRSKLFIIDKIVLKLDDSKKPKGLGPKETVVAASPIN